MTGPQIRFLSFLTPNCEPTWGCESGGAVYDLGPTGSRLAATLRDAVARGVFGAVTAETLHSLPVHSTDDIRFLPPITDPGKVICVGVNYLSHQKETNKPAPSAPTIFTRFIDTQIGHSQPALMPRETISFDYEGELALVIGKPAWKVSRDEALKYVAGYAVYNDFSVRDWQLAAAQWTPGKNFPGTGGFGPYLVPSADVDIPTLELETRVNGERRQHTKISEMHFSIPELIEYITTFTPLDAGDVIVTGTPGGVGMFMPEGGLLKEGDVVEVEITGLGVLRNVVSLERVNS